jgi:hypothetical protein
VKRASLAATVLLCAALSGAAEAPSAQELLDDVLAQLPRQPLLVTGELLVRKQHGIPVEVLQFEMLLQWGREPATVRYTIRDAFGADLEQMTVTRAGGDRPRFEYQRGKPLADAALPDLFAPIQGTDIGWTDLTLSFLWWTGGAIAGTNAVRGRACTIVEVPAPAQAGANRAPPSDAGKTATPYSKVRLWIDDQLHMLLQAEGYDRDGRLLRRLWIRSFKKIEETWMVKDMEIQQYPAVHRTKLQVHDLEVKPRT